MISAIARKDEVATMSEALAVDPDSMRDRRNLTTLECWNRSTRATNTERLKSGDRPLQTIVNQLIAFTNEELLVSSGGGGADDWVIDAETPILEMGLLDSLSMVSLLTFIHTRFGIYVPDETVIPENFENLQTLAELIVRQQAEQTELPSETETGNALLETIRILEASGIKRETVMLEAGTAMHVLKVSGRKPTWVLLPGLGNPSSSWGTMLRSLANENEAIAVDFAGFGVSRCQQEKPNYYDHLHATLALLETIGEPPFILVGSSAGAMIATELARQKPEWISALVITGFGLIEDAEAWWQGLRALSSLPEKFLEAAYYRPPKLTETLRQLIDDVLSRPAYHSFLEGGGLAAMKTAFDDLSVPTLFVAGEQDNIIPQSAVRAAAGRVPGARIDWLSRCGHFPPAEQPEELLYVIRSFVGKLS